MNPSVDELTALAGTYRLLSRLWIREVDLRFLQSLREAPLCDAFTAAGGILPEDFAPSTLEELAVDYCQLFLGPANHLPPFQSVWKHGQFLSESVDSMRHYVSASGCVTSGVMVDHLGVQLDVMGCFLASVSQSEQHCGDASDLAATYFTEHLIWAAPLLELAIHRAATDFYRSTIRMTRDFLNSEETFWTGLRS